MSGGPLSESIVVDKATHHREYGPKAVTLFAKTKELLDSLNIFNSGKKVGGTIEYAKDHMIKRSNN